jgi:hypothetical protein
MILYVIIFLFVIFVVALIIRRGFYEELLTPLDVAEELLPLIDDDRRFVRHFRTYLKKKKITGEGQIVGEPFESRGTVAFTLTATSDAQSSEDIILERVVLTLLFFKVDAPTEVDDGYFVGFKGVLVDADVKGSYLDLVIDISELTHVGKGREVDIY